MCVYDANSFDQRVCVILEICAANLARHACLGLTLDGRLEPHSQGTRTHRVSDS